MSRHFNILTGPVVAAAMGAGPSFIPVESNQYEHLVKPPARIEKIERAVGSCLLPDLSRPPVIKTVFLHMAIKTDKDNPWQMVRGANPGLSETEIAQLDQQALALHHVADANTIPNGTQLDIPVKIGVHTAKVVPCAPQSALAIGINTAEYALLNAQTWTIEDGSEGAYFKAIAYGSTPDKRPFADLAEFPLIDGAPIIDNPINTSHIEGPSPELTGIEIDTHWPLQPHISSVSTRYHDWVNAISGNTTVQL